ncbi:MAG TPA: phytanoyl-CoA dioxygenase family protein [Blastocatellia bacterium]|jgi:phytanoyl-CoA hydroxylase|nr:phytanoyl-CoA dioxygenase family protein [Blastocatellia bacterium]
MKLTSKQKVRYERDGFLVLEDFVSRESCAALRKQAEEMVANFEPQGAASVFSTRDQARTSDDYFLESGDKIRFFFEEDAFDAGGKLRQDKARSINKIGHALHDLDPVFDRFSRTDALAGLIRDLGFARPLLLQSMYIFKQPAIGGEVSCHQDGSFLYTEPMSLVGLWFALEDATLENGCLRAIPGGHRLGLKSRFMRAEGGGTRFEIFDHEPWPLDRLTPLEVREGALIVIHGLLPHMSYANKSQKSRQAYTLHVIEEGARYPAENWLQRGIDAPLRGFCRG